MRHRSSWHECAKWILQGLVCPFQNEAEDESEEDAKTVPYGWIGAGVATLELLRRHGRAMADAYDVLREAEDIVAKEAARIPMPEGAVGEPVAGSLREALVLGGASVATGAAAAWAIRQVVRAGGGAGGYHFPSRIDPRRAAFAR